MAVRWGEADLALQPLWTLPPLGPEHGAALRSSWKEVEGAARVAFAEASVDAMADVSPEAYARLAAQGLGLVAASRAIALLEGEMQRTAIPRFLRAVSSRGTKKGCVRLTRALLALHESKALAIDIIVALFEAMGADVRSGDSWRRDNRPPGIRFTEVDSLPEFEANTRSLLRAVRLFSVRVERLVTKAGACSKLPLFLGDMAVRKLREFSKSLRSADGSRRLAEGGSPLLSLDGAGAAVRRLLQGMQWADDSAGSTHDVWSHLWSESEEGGEDEDEQEDEEEEPAEEEEEEEEDLQGEEAEGEDGERTLGIGTDSVTGASEEFRRPGETKGMGIPSASGLKGGLSEAQTPDRLRRGWQERLESAAASVNGAREGGKVNGEVLLSTAVAGSRVAAGQGDGVGRGGGEGTAEWQAREETPAELQESLEAAILSRLGAKAGRKVASHVGAAWLLEAALPASLLGEAGLGRILSQAYAAAVLTALRDGVKAMCAEQMDQSALAVAGRLCAAVLMPFLSVMMCHHAALPNQVEELEDWQIRLDLFSYQAVARMRAGQLFDIVVDYPESQCAIEDLKLCLQRTGDKASVIHAYSAALSSRLLTAGASTSDILHQYVSTIRALRALDPSGVILEAVSEPIRQYLRGRKDTIRCIMTMLTEDPASEAVPGGNAPLADPGSAPLQQLCLLEEAALAGDPDLGLSLASDWQPLGDGVEVSADDEQAALEAAERWEPDSVEADPATMSRQRRTMDIVRLLVAIFGSQELFVAEYRVMLAERLLAAPGFDTDREVRTLELLKLRFGEAHLHSCEVMLKDLAESKRADTNIRKALAQEQAKQKERKARARARVRQHIHATLAKGPASLADGLSSARPGLAAPAGPSGSGTPPRLSFRAAQPDARLAPPNALGLPPLRFASATPEPAPEPLGRGGGVPGRRAGWGMGQQGSRAAGDTSEGSPLRFDPAFATPLAAPGTLVPTMLRFSEDRGTGFSADSYSTPAANQAVPPGASAAVGPPGLGQNPFQATREVQDRGVREGGMLEGVAALSFATPSIQTPIAGLQGAGLGPGLGEISGQTGPNTGGEEEEQEEAEEEDLRAEQLHAKIVSALFWPPFQEESVVLPPDVERHLAAYSERYTAIKAPRKLEWRKNLGCVKLEIELQGGRMEQFSVTPVQAAVILRFQDQKEPGAVEGEADTENQMECKPQWLASDLASALGLSVATLRKRIAIWVNAGVVLETASQTTPVEPLYIAADSRADGDAAAEGGSKVPLRGGYDGDEEGGGGSMVASMEAQREEDSAVHESYILGMLTTFDGLPLERIHNMLKLFVTDPPYDKSLHHLQTFLARLITEEKVELRDGAYKKKS